MYRQRSASKSGVGKWWQGIAWRLRLAPKTNAHAALLPSILPLVGTVAQLTCEDWHACAPII